jgi:hypothetical protein
MTLSSVTRRAREKSPKMYPKPLLMKSIHNVSICFANDSFWVGLWSRLRRKTEPPHFRPQLRRDNAGQRWGLYNKIKNQKLQHRTRSFFIRTGLRMTCLVLIYIVFHSQNLRYCIYICLLVTNPSSLYTKIDREGSLSFKEILIVMHNTYIYVPIYIHKQHLTDLWPNLVRLEKSAIYAEKWSYHMFSRK